MTQGKVKKECSAQINIKITQFKRKTRKNKRFTKEYSLKKMTLFPQTKLICFFNEFLFLFVISLKGK